MPAKTRLTPELSAQICGYVNGGAPIPAACVACGVSWNTCKQWIRQGRKGRVPYAGFVEALAQAKARWEAGAALRITKAADKDWKAAAWLLERRSKHWNPPRQRVEQSGPEGKPIAHEVKHDVVDGLSGDALVRAAKAILGGGE